MSALETPKWAFERAFVLANADGVPATDLSTWTAAINAFAAYIAAHEEPPVDPLLIEAREIVADWWERNPARFPGSSAKDFRSGKRDGSAEIEQAVAALRRGLELAKTGGDQI